MADNKQQDGGKVQSIALTLFGQRTAAMNGRASEAVAMQCFRDASAFLKVAELVQVDGVAQSDDANPLSDAFCPNALLKKKDPLNIMSREWGSLEQVKKILDELSKNPAATTYEELGWGPQQVNQARDLFPAVVDKANKLSKV